MVRVDAWHTGVLVAFISMPLLTELVSTLETASAINMALLTELARAGGLRARLLAGCSGYSHLGTD